MKYSLTDIGPRIKEIINEKLGISQKDIRDESSFTNDLAVDSLDLYELILEVENEFNIRIPDEQAGKLGTVGALISYVTEHTAP